jgi:hypothetical protein
MAQPGGGGPGYDPSRGRFIGTLRLGFQLMERLAFPETPLDCPAVRPPGTGAFSFGHSGRQIRKLNLVDVSSNEERSLVLTCCGGSPWPPSRSAQLIFGARQRPSY